MADLHSVLTGLLEASQLLSEESDRWAYGVDNSRVHALPDLVVLPDSEEQVAAVVALCNQHQIPITTRGRGTGTTGGAVPDSGGVVLCLEKMSRIIEVDPDNRLMRVEAGVTNAAVQRAAAEHGFFWPPDPTSSEVCTVGGNIACNAAGPRAVKYGTTRESVLGLRVVTASGSALKCGVMTSKGVVGYDTTRLFIGSEGTLGIVTEATLRLLPLPQGRRTLRALYHSTEGAARAIAAIMAQPATPSALELLDAKALALISQSGQITLPDEAAALLMIEVDGGEAALDEAVSAISRAADNSDCLELRSATGEEEVKALWSVRKALSPVLRKVAPKKINEDVVVPVSRLPELISGTATIAQNYQITIVNFGHAGNGNIHVNLLIDPDDPQQQQAAKGALDELFNLVLRLGGTLSGEHGIGLVKRQFVARELDPVAIEYMRGIKRLFDPNNILNPNKTIP